MWTGNDALPSFEGVGWAKALALHNKYEELHSASEKDAFLRKIVTEKKFSSILDNTQRVSHCLYPSFFYSIKHDPPTQDFSIVIEDENDDETSLSESRRMDIQKYSSNIRGNWHKRIDVCTVCKEVATKDDGTTHTHTHTLIHTHALTLAHALTRTH